VWGIEKEGEEELGGGRRSGCEAFRCMDELEEWQRSDGVREEERSESALRLSLRRSMWRSY